MSTVAWSASAVMSSLDDCEKIALAPTLAASQYSTMPARAAAALRPPIAARRLFDPARVSKTDLIKRSVVEGNPVLVDTGTFVVVDGRWTAGGGGGGAGGDESPSVGCGQTFVVAYDDARLGGSFELMQRCGGSADRFFWIEYAEFERVGGCAIEIVGGEPKGRGLRTLSGTVRFEDSSGEAMPSRPKGRLGVLEREYPSRTRFRIRMQNAGPAFVYAFATDGGQKIHQLFPLSETSALLPYRENRWAIPGETTFLQLDEKPGTDYFCLLVSERELDFASLKSRLERNSGDLVSRLESSMKNQLVRDIEVRRLADGQVAFEAKVDGQATSAAIVFGIKHVR